MTVDTATERTALYRFFDVSGSLLYVGITKNFGQRWLSHATKKPWWPEAQSHTAEWFNTRREAAAAEKEAVVAEAPKYNLVHKPRPPRKLIPRPTPKPKQLADPDTDFWDLADIADHWGVTAQTIRTYRSRKRGELPEPDKVFGRSPVWKPSTIIGFVRPGQGARTDLPERPAAGEERSG